MDKVNTYTAEIKIYAGTKAKTPPLYTAVQIFTAEAVNKTIIISGGTPTETVIATGETVWQAVLNVFKNKCTPKFKPDDENG